MARYFVSGFLLIAAVEVATCEFERPARCNIMVASYSSVGCPASKPLVGFVDLNGERVWQAAMCGYNGFVPMRGVNILIIDPVSCSATDIYNFDTYLNANNAVDLANYLHWIPTGTVVVGVTGDEPSQNLAPALSVLRVAGVNVDDVQLGGNYAFVLQKGFQKKTQMVKSINNKIPLSVLSVRIEGNSNKNLKIIPISKFSDVESQ